MNTETVNDLGGFLAFVARLGRDGSRLLWYRGSEEATHDLKPSLYRHPSITDVGQLMDLEAAILGRFKNRCIPYLNGRPTSDWEYLFLMQHVGVPTRLLDWTESPYVALYFAVANKAVPGEAACVWILAPEDWNRYALRHVTFKGGVLSTEDDLLAGHAPKPNRQVGMANMPRDPVAIYGAHNSQRIVAQKGVFTIFGKETTPMETAASQPDAPADLLTNVVIPQASAESIRCNLFMTGMSDSTIWPDLDGLARELRRKFDFKVSL